MRSTARVLMNYGRSLVEGFTFLPHYWLMQRQRSA
jgi:hypothetical protein